MFYHNAQGKNRIAFLALTAAVAVLISRCGNASAAGQEMAAQPPVALPVLSVATAPATTHRDYSATVEGKFNIEIRAQVDGYLDKIYVDEGALVKAGQPLFKVNDRTYNEQLSNAKAALQAAIANQQKAQVEVDRLTPLVSNNVVSPVQLQTAQSALAAAKATVAQSEALVHNAQINVGYTLITAPVSGYVDRIPYKTGSLVGRNEALPLTTISDVSEVYAYFSMSEVDFEQFKQQFPGSTIQEKLRHLPAAELVLANNTVYNAKGRVETVEGQFDKTMGSISFRATFPNTGGMLRSGNTGKVRISQSVQSAIIVPQEATFEIQDKVFVFAVADSNKVISKPIGIAGKTANYYFVSNGVTPGERIVLTGIGNLRNGTVITPQPVSADSLLKSRPL
ncbi:MAG: efflux RND transporter periplasmic adaptor subunit [Chitinophagaceae bacterium]